MSARTLPLTTLGPWAGHLLAQASALSEAVLPWCGACPGMPDAEAGLREAGLCRRHRPRHGGQRVGVLEDSFTFLGIFLAIVLFPFGFICCFALRKRRCPNCGANFT